MSGKYEFLKFLTFRNRSLFSQLKIMLKIGGFLRSIWLEWDDESGRVRLACPVGKRGPKYWLLWMQAKLAVVQLLFVLIRFPAQFTTSRVNILMAATHLLYICEFITVTMYAYILRKVRHEHCAFANATMGWLVELERKGRMEKNFPKKLVSPHVPCASFYMLLQI